MTLQLFVVAHILVGLITSIYFKKTVADKLSKEQKDNLQNYLEGISDYNTKAFVEVLCNQTLTGFMLKFLAFLLFMSGILAPIGYYRLNKELGSL